MVKDKRKSRAEKKKVEEFLSTREVEGKILEKAARSWSLSSILEELGLGIDPSSEYLRGFLSLVKGKHAALDALEEALAVVDDLSQWKSDQYLAARTEDRLPTLDEVLEGNNISKIEVAGALAASAWAMGVEQGRAILAANLPEVIRSAVGLATSGESMVNHLSQKLLFEASGLLAKGPSTVVNVNTQNNVVNGLPQWSEVDKVVGKAYFGKDEVKGLPPAQVENVVEGELVREEAYEPVQ